MTLNQDESSSTESSGAGTARDLSRARHGDSDGFAGLFERLAPALYGWACLRIHPGMRDRLDPEDLVQEVWWRVMETFETYDSSKSA